MPTQNPFKIGDRVVFAPDERTTGWYQHSFERWGMLPGDEGIVTRILGDKVEINNNPNTMLHWTQYRMANHVSANDRNAMRLEYMRRRK